MNKKIILLALGSIFFFYGIFSGTVDSEYLGIGTWAAGIVYFALFPERKEIASIILGLIVLHIGVLFILKENISNIKLLGFVIFTIGIVFVLNSGISDYMRNRKK